MSLPRFQAIARSTAFALTGAAAIAISANGVFASLNAIASHPTPQPVNAGALKLTLANQSGFGSFSDAIDNMAIGDTVNRYVDLVNSGTLDGKDLALEIQTSADSTATLVSDAVGGGTNKALAITVKSCSVVWSADGTCSTGAKVELAEAALSTFAAAKSLSSSLLAGNTNATLHLQISVSLPDQSETVVDGVLPANTVQGGTAHLTYTFSELQRTGRSTIS